MRKIIQQLAGYAATTNKKVFVLSALLMAVAIGSNYQFGLARQISRLPFYQEAACWYGLFLAAFLFPYLLQYRTRSLILHNRAFLGLLLLAPALFAWKMAYIPQFSLHENPLHNAYWNRVAYWPFKLLVITGVLWFIWKRSGANGFFYGLSTRNFSAKPYGLMLLLMVPLVAAASTQADFLYTYPKCKELFRLPLEDQTGWRFLLFELSYGTDFIGIELFFRGFLILAFARWVGPDAVLPMALFYCTIHFGKPLGECISSFFGGILLGVVTYHSRSILGGLMVHLGIAWLMELGGYLGRSG